MEKCEPQKEYECRIQIVTSDPVLESINRILQQTVSSYSSNFSIYRVPEPLRSINPEAYTPTLISIGPLHSGRKELMANSHKPIFLQNFLNLTKLPLYTIIETVKISEEQARCCYAESIEMNNNEFVELLVLDGCFVVMYIITSQFPELRSPNTSNLLRFWDQIFCDLLLLENQLPYFLLQSLYDLCSSSQTFTTMCEFHPPCYNEEGLDFLKKHVLLTDMDGKVNHLVDFVRTHFAHSCSTKTLFHRTFWPPTATQLHECGVVFRTDKGSKKCAVDVAFIDYDGCLELPQIIIYDGFETRVRNLIAYEQCHAGEMREEVSNFAVFMQYMVQNRARREIAG
ncbi:unnamed protein product [Citrullus colocynthis]|uniref:Uncharacterized protein n=1 Tax=Citrullus colocynthis TaxID=252529 RepID=A0ABP0XXF7_9ROSI